MTYWWEIHTHTHISPSFKFIPTNHINLKDIQLCFSFIAVSFILVSEIKEQMQILSLNLHFLITKKLFLSFMPSIFAFSFSFLHFYILFLDKIIIFSLFPYVQESKDSLAIFHMYMYVVSNNHRISFLI